MSTPVVGVVGASARAAVHSLARAGLRAWAVDLFADRDLARVAPCVRCPFDDYPAGLAALAQQSPPGPVLYTGGLENHSAVVAELAASRELWGNPPAVLEAVRDAHQVAAVPTGAGIPAPAFAPPGSPCPATGRWLRKPLRSSAGHGIRFALPGDRPSVAHYFQQYISGAAISAIFAGEELFGVTAQLVGERWLHAEPFAYCGSIGPATVGPELSGRLVRLGGALGAAFGLRGVWNIDVVVTGGVPYPVEVNPRYSASVEVVEHATNTAILASGGRQPPDAHFDQGADAPRSHGVAFGKAIYFSPHAITFPDSGPWDTDLAGAFDPCRLPAFADIPEAGSRIAAGQPVLTVLVSGSSPRECRERLQSRAAELDALFAGGEP